MKALNTLRVLTVILVFVVMNGCAGKDKSEEIRTVMEKNLKIMENFIKSVGETEDPQVFLSALQKMKTEIQKLIPEMNELDKKYPELFKLDEKKEPTPELKNILKDLVVREVKVRSKFVAAMQKVMKNAKDPEIMKELQEIYELQKIMTN